MQKMRASIGSVVALALTVGVFFGTVRPVSSQPAAQEEVCRLPFESVAVPLPELGGQEYVRMDGTRTGFSGGLYPQGSNQPPAAHLEAGLRLADEIQPLDANGQPDPQKGRILFISLGMSNTGAEFDAFTQLAQQTSGLNPRMVLFNGALASQTAERWLEADALAWQEMERKISGYGFSNLQVQAAWVKQTLTGGGEFPQKAQALQADLEVIVRHLKEKFPNLKIIFLSSRTRSYTYWRGLSPEPLAYETGFAVKWLIEKQINGDPGLNFDPQKGAVVAPYLTWGPYLWADGQNPRADGLVWLAEDMTGDCTHPSRQGAAKVAEMLLAFFSQDSTSRGWFLAGQATPQPTRQPPTRAPSPTTASPSATPPAAQPNPSTEPSPTRAPAAATPLPAIPKTIPAAVWVGGGLIGLVIAAGLALRARRRA
ncbi:MAG: SGNH/GDSL hydrolase family protein [Chloroflexota bacterium]